MPVTIIEEKPLSKLAEEERALKELQRILSVQNRKPCTCEAQVHSLIANCLGCGRIVCDAEGPGKCLTCDNLVLTRDQRSRLQKHISLMPTTAQGGIASNENERRVRVIDDHFDYFAIAHQSWMSPAERQSLQNQVDELQEAKYKRKSVLNVDLENLTVDYDSEPVVDNFNDRIRQLQIKADEASNGQIATCSLPELVAQEATRKYKFRYIPVEKRDLLQQKEQKYQSTIQNSKSSVDSCYDQPNQSSSYNQRPPDPNRRSNKSHSKQYKQETNKKTSTNASHSSRSGKRK